MALFGFVGWNRGKRSLVLDLKRAGARETFLDLARSADVVVDNFRGGVMDRLGIGWEALTRVNPRLVHTSITGYGSTGPLASLPGFDPIFQAQSGLMLAQGRDEPVFHMVAYNDYMAGTLGALATVAALVARERTGRGQRVDVSLLRTTYVAQAAEMVLAEGVAPGPSGGRDFLGPAACRRLYACADGWLCVAGTTAEHAAGLGRVAGVDVSLADGAEGTSAAVIARALGDGSRADGVARLRAAGVPATASLAFQDLFTDPLLRDHGHIVEHLHPTLGSLLVPAPFVRFDGAPARPGRSSPVLGIDGEAVLGEIGYGADRVAALVAAGIVGRPT
jgi:crotonobetainyl-CoA:carnitine CoA-transferase CaiB-like acyl-CoA transferase